MYESFIKNNKENVSIVTYRLKTLDIFRFCGYLLRQKSYIQRPSCIFEFSLTIIGIACLKYVSNDNSNFIRETLALLLCIYSFHFK